MRNAPRLREEDHLVDAGILELPEPRADLRGRSDAIRGATLGQREIRRLVFEAFPQIRLARLMTAEEAVVPEAVNEKAVILGRDRADLVLVAIAQERARDGDVRVDRIA